MIKKIKNANISRRVLSYIIDIFPLIIIYPLINNNIFYLLFIVYFIFFLIKDSFNGISIGSKILKIKVINNKTNKNCNIIQSVIRNIILPLGILDLFIFELNNNEKRLGDIIANTRVIDNK